MSQELDRMTGRQIGEWHLSPPEVHIAQNGFVLRTYNPGTDQIVYTIAADAEAVRVALHEWADMVSAGLRKAVERQLDKVA